MKSNVFSERRSIRGFLKKNVAEELVMQLLEAGRWAPSGLNNQPWRFMVIRNEEIKCKLADLTESSSVVKAAPALIAVFLDRDAVYNRDKDLQAVGACIQNILLAGHLLGLGTCWLGEILNEKARVKRVLKASKKHEFMALIAVGWPTVRRLSGGSRKSLKRLMCGGL